jgi:hypothetical protein
VAFQTCINASSVCRVFETSRRHDVLSFEHHKTVAALKPEIADSLLDWREARSMARIRLPLSVLREIGAFCLSFSLNFLFKFAAGFGRYTVRQI